jgi:hypothetical protein
MTSYPSYPSYLVDDVTDPTISLFSSMTAKAKALYEYEGGNPDELSFNEGDVLSIVDKSEGEWWKAEKNGVVSIVPASYLEVVEG